MAPMIAERIKVIDSDTHVTEPPDLWTSRVSNKWGDRVPHLETDAKSGREEWVMGGKQKPLRLGHAAGGPSIAGKKLVRLADIDRAATDSQERLKRMDEFGIYAHVIYPNVAGFGSGRFMKLGEPELMLECVQAYNNFLTDWATPDPKRLIPISVLPFWDVEASVKEIHRCFKMGHKGILMGSEPEVFDQPRMADSHYDPIYQTAQDLGLAVNFHVASGDIPTFFNQGFEGNHPVANSVMYSTLFFMTNANCIAELICSGMCEKYPNLNFVSVESGVGWIPFLLRALDWQWVNHEMSEFCPEYKLLPSEYARRQIYSCFWFEGPEAKAAIDILGTDNILYETDFPHPTSMAPAPSSPKAQLPKDFIEATLSDLPEETLQKILHDNAARLYHLDD